MSNPSDDIITNVEATESDVLDLKKSHYTQGGGTRTPPPVAVQNRLQEELLNMLKIGKKYAQFQGIDRCIRVLDPGKPSQRHCMSMMVKDLTRNMVVCTSCDRIRDLNANPRTINSSQVKLDHKDLEEMGLSVDPTAAMKPVSVTKEKAKTVKSPQRRVKVAVPNNVKIEISMKELQNDPNVVNVLLKKTLDAIFELPVKNFREAEEIRVVKERVEGFLNPDKPMEER